MSREDEFESAPDDEFEDGPAEGPFIVRKHGLAKVTGLTIEDLDTLVRKGCPTHGERKRGAQLVFDIRTAVPWIIGTLREAEGIEGAKQRQAMATARKREAEAEKLEGRLVDIETVEAAIRDGVAAWRSTFLAIPTRVPPEAREAVQGEIESAINSLAVDIPGVDL
jgi:phage terminase Nu1 subunit (DNA packaging protein)